MSNRLPWIPSDDDVDCLFDTARSEPLRNRLMLSLCYDCGLRRDELCHLETGDFDPARKLVTIRAETTKNRYGRVIPYTDVTSILHAAYLCERHVLSAKRGPLFLSCSRRNYAMPISGWTWSKVIGKMAAKAQLPRLGTHTFRHYRLTELARAGWDLSEIAAFAGHRSLRSTSLYIHLSGRDLADKYTRTMAGLRAHNRDLVFEEPG